MNEDFKERLARLEAKNDAQPLQSLSNAPQPSEHPPGSNGDGTRSRAKVPWGAITIVVGLAALGLGVHMTTEKLKVLLPVGGFADATILENAILSRMTPEDIERMNSDPNLAGKTQMERLLLSHQALLR